MREDNRREVKKAPRDEEKFDQVLLIKRVSKKTPGGNHISFSALVVVGDRKGKVGIGLKRALEVPKAIRKSIDYAKKHMITVPIYNSTLPHDIKIKYKAAVLLLKPAPQGAGLKAGSVVRTILSLTGITNASAKILGSRNQITNSYAVMKALSSLKKR